jgi:hypothetical protein
MLTLTRLNVWGAGFCRPYRRARQAAPPHATAIFDAIADSTGPLWLDSTNAIPAEAIDTFAG